MNCHDIADILDDRDSSELNAADMLAVESHLSGCENCARAFRAHAAMLAATVPPLPAEFAARCRHLVAARSVAPASRTGTRPFVVGALLLATAAAAVVGVQVVGGFDNGSSAQLTAAPAPVPAPEAGDSLPDDSRFDFPPAPAGNGNAVVNDAAEAVATGAASGYTVAVRLVQRATNPEAIRYTETLYLSFVDGLRQLPGLELIELESPAEADGIAPAAPGAERLILDSLNDSAGIGAPPAITFETFGREGTIGGESGGTAGRNVVVVDTRTLVYGAGNASSTETLTTVPPLPTALIGRIETLTGGASGAIARCDGELCPNAVPDVINVILQNNIEGLTVDLSASLSEPEPLLYDYQLDVNSNNMGEQWQLNVTGKSRDGLTVTVGAGSSGFRDSASSREMVVGLVDRLRQVFLPPDASLIQEFESQWIDSANSMSERFRALSALTAIATRSHDRAAINSSISGAVTLAAESDDAARRESIWRLLQGVDDPRLIRPLSDALLVDTSDGVRLQLARTLSEYADDPFARSMLAAVGQSDASAPVRAMALWGSLDDAGRREHVVNTLLNGQLTDTERLAPFDLDPDGSMAGIGQIGLDDRIDGNVAAALAGLIRRTEDADRRARVLTALMPVRAASLAPVMIDRLTNDPDSRVRSTAATGLRQYLDDFGVRPALEQAAAADPSEAVRRAATRQLNSSQ